MLKIREFDVGGESPCFIVAEIGQNHQGDIEIAKRMIAKAKECGVSCVKFQKSSLPHRFTQAALKAPYSGMNSFGKTYGEHRAHLEFSEEDFKTLQEYAEQSVGVMFTASCMDIPSATFLESIGVPFLKIGSGDTNNPFLIEHVAKMGIPIVLSTGMSDFETVQDAYNIIKAHHSNFALMHCTSAYPTHAADVNLAVLNLYKNYFPDVPVGYSGHEKGIFISIGAVARGAKIIERHFTLDKGMKGTDHACSLDPQELKCLVEGIREVEVSIGRPIKCFLPSETPCRTKLGKTLVTSNLIQEGATIEKLDVAIKVSRPAGLPPRFLKDILGCKAKRSLPADIPITLEDIVRGTKY